MANPIRLQACRMSTREISRAYAANELLGLCNPSHVIAGSLQESADLFRLKSLNFNGPVLNRSACSQSMTQALCQRLQIGMGDGRWEIVGDDHHFSASLGC